MSEAGIAAALQRVAALGPYFEVRTEPSGDDWSSTADLHGAALAGRMRLMRSVLAGRTGVAAAAIDLRACASTDLLGLLSRVLAPALGTAAVCGLAPSLDPSNVLVPRVGSGPVPITWVGPGSRVVRDVVDAANALGDGVLDPVVAPLVDAYRTAFGLSPKVAWGNVASALAGAAGIIEHASAPGRVRPGRIVEALLQRGSLNGTGNYLPPPEPARFVRRNCCLFYRIPGGGLCADCVLR